MNRQRVIVRDFNEEGSQRAQQMGLALAAKCDPDFLEALLDHIGALDQFGGELYLSSVRRKFSDEGQPVDASEPGTFETVGYVFHYGSKARVKRLATEEEAAPSPEPRAETPEPVTNGAEPEPVES